LGLGVWDMAHVSCVMCFTLQLQAATTTTNDTLTPPLPAEPHQNQHQPTLLALALNLSSLHWAWTQSQFTHTHTAPVCFKGPRSFLQGRRYWRWRPKGKGKREAPLLPSPPACLLLLHASESEMASASPSCTWCAPHDRSQFQLSLSTLSNSIRLQSAITIICILHPHHYASPAWLVSVPFCTRATGNSARILSMGMDWRMTLPGPSSVVEKNPSPLKQHVQQLPLARTSSEIF